MRYVPNYGSVPLEGLVRPFQKDDSPLANERPIEREVEVEDGTICWGRPAILDVSATTNNFPRVTINWGDDPSDPPDPPNAIRYTEIYRATEDVRVENPEDAEQYVIVRRITEIWFSGDDGLTHIFDLNHPAGSNV